MILDLIWKTIFDVKIVYTFHHVAIINYLYQLSFFNSTVVDRPRILFFLTKCFFFIFRAFQIFAYRSVSKNSYRSPLASK